MAKVLFELESETSYETESLWAKVVADGEFVLDNVPFFAFGVSCGDRVRAKPLENVFQFVEVAEPSGHSTYRAYLEESATEEQRDRYLAQLKALGCHLERGTKRLWAFDLPPTTDIHAVYAVLEQAEAEGVWEFEEGHVGHPLA